MGRQSDRSEWVARSARGDDVDTSHGGAHRPVCSWRLLFVVELGCGNGGKRSCSLKRRINPPPETTYASRGHQVSHQNHRIGKAQNQNHWRLNSAGIRTRTPVAGRKSVANQNQKTLPIVTSQNPLPENRTRTTGSGKRSFAGSEKRSFAGSGKRSFARSGERQNHNHRIRKDRFAGKKSFAGAGSDNRESRNSNTLSTESEEVYVSLIPPSSSYVLVPILMFDNYLDKIGIGIPFWDVSFDHGFLGLLRLVAILMFDYYLDKIGRPYLDITFEHEPGRLKERTYLSGE
ncbi:hypothetical protein LXL04_028002 [Taraxacum kok-saghyz]